MLLQEFGALVHHYRKWIVIVPVIVMLVAGLFGALRGQEYVVESALTITDTTGALSSEGVFNLVSAITEEQSALLDQRDVDVELARRAGTDTAVFTIKSDSEEVALQEASEAAEGAAKEIRLLLADQAAAYRDAIGQDALDSLSGYTDGALPAVSAVDRVAALESCVVVVSEPHVLGTGGGNKPFTFAAIGLVGGMVVVLAVCVCIYLAKRPVISRKQLEDLTEIPVVDVRAPRKGNPIAQLWVNAYLCCKRACDATVLLISLSGNPEELKMMMGAQAAVNGLSAEKPKIDIVSCGSIVSRPQLLIEVQEKGQVLLVIKAWKDSIDEVGDVLGELKRGGAPLCSIALAE